jgi:ribose transport system permease protein
MRPATTAPSAGRGSISERWRALRRNPRVSTLLRQSGLLWVLVALCVVATFSSSAFLQEGNLINVLREVALVGIVGIGMTFVILLAGIDLSVGSIVGVVAVVCADLMSRGAPVAVVIAAGLALGAFIGLLNGIGIVKGKVPAFVMTLATLSIARGVALSVSHGQPVAPGESITSFTWLGNGDFLGLPNPVWIFAGVFVIAGIVLRYTPYGRYVFAVGDNREAARLAGINVGLIQASVYVISGLLAGVTAVIFLSRLTIGDPTLGTGLELQAIAVVVIGGTSLFGGEGGVSGTLIGAAIVSVLANLLNLVGVSPFTQQIVQGGVLALAVLVDQLQRRRRSSRKRKEGPSAALPPTAGAGRSAPAVTTAG